MGIDDAHKALLATLPKIMWPLSSREMTAVVMRYWRPRLNIETSVCEGGGTSIAMLDVHLRSEGQGSIF